MTRKQPAPRPKKAPDASIKTVTVPVHEFGSSTAYLNALVTANRHYRGFRSKLATVAGCTPSFLSQVLAGDANFSLDHLCRVTRFMGLSDVEWLYVRELLIAEKSTFRDVAKRSRTMAESLQKRAARA